VAVPKRRKSRSERDKRRANHDRVTAPNSIPCPKCGDTFAARYVVAQTALRNPGRTWHVRSLHAAGHNVFGELADLQPAP